MPSLWKQYCSTSLCNLETKAFISTAHPAKNSPYSHLFSSASERLADTNSRNFPGSFQRASSVQRGTQAAVCRSWSLHGAGVILCLEQLTRCKQEGKLPMPQHESRQQEGGIKMDWRQLKLHLLPSTLCPVNLPWIYDFHAQKRWL